MGCWFQNNRTKGVKEINEKVVVERDSTLGIIKKMTFQSEKRWEICFKAMTWKKKRGRMNIHSFL